MVPKTKQLPSTTYSGAVDLGLDKVVAVDGGRNGNLGQARADELQHGHLHRERTTERCPRNCAHRKKNIPACTHAEAM
jgi:hypothetical protein